MIGAWSLMELLNEQEESTLHNIPIRIMMLLKLTNEGTKNKKQIQDESIQRISSKNGEELNEEDAEEKTLLKQTQELDTCATTSKVENSK